MADIHSICLCAFLLAFICKHGILHVEGRPMKSSYPITAAGSRMVSRRSITDYISDTTPSYSPGVVVEDKVNVAQQFHKNPTDVYSMADHKDGTSSNHSPGVGKKDSKEYKKNDHTLATSHFIKEDTDHMNPSHSPSVGHKHFAEYKKNVYALVKRHSITYNIDDTSPGHSPGVGHGHLEAKKIVHDPTTQHTSTIDTIPGHSPSVGHKHSIKHYRTDAQLEEHGRNSAFSHDSIYDDIKDTSPGHSPGVGHECIDKYAKQRVAQDHNGKEKPNDTSPGHSPGVGHKYIVDKENERS